MIYILCFKRYIYIDKYNNLMYTKTNTNKNNLLKGGTNMKKIFNLKKITSMFLQSP